MSKKTGDWKKVESLLFGMDKKAGDAMKLAIKAEAMLYRKKVVEAFNSGGSSNGNKWPPIKDSTKLKRKQRGHTGTKPLIASAQLRNSVVIKHLGTHVSFVGVTSASIRKEGLANINIARVHEFGAAVPNGNTVVTIPKRSFLNDTLAAHFKQEQVQPRVLAIFVRRMG